MKRRDAMGWLLCAALALPAGCRGETQAEQATPRANLATLRSLSQGTRAPKVALARKARTEAELGQHMLGVAETLTGASLLTSEARSWAKAVFRKGEFERHASAPFSSHPEIRASYVRYFDELRVTVGSIEQPDRVEMLSSPPTASLAAGTGADAAEKIAEDLLSRLETNGHIDAGPYAHGGTRSSARTLANVQTREQHSLVRDYTPFYYRTIDQIPLLNTLIAVTVARNGKVKRVHVQEIGAVATDGVMTLISDSQAFELMATQAERSVSAGTTVDETVLSDRQVGYFLPADTRSATLAPIAKAKVAFRTPTQVTRARVAAIPLDESHPTFRFLPGA